MLNYLCLSPPQDGVISVKDIDLVMSEGLGMRYAFIGPMETIHLNAPEGKRSLWRVLFTLRENNSLKKASACSDS